MVVPADRLGLRLASRLRYSMFCCARAGCAGGCCGCGGWATGGACWYCGGLYCCCCWSNHRTSRSRSTFPTACSQRSFGLAIPRLFASSTYLCTSNPSGVTFPVCESNNQSEFCFSRPSTNCSLSLCFMVSSTICWACLAARSWTMGPSASSGLVRNFLAKSALYCWASSKA